MIARAILILLLSCSALAEAREVTVRLLTNQAPAAAEIAPTGELRWRVCATCPWKTAAQPLELRVQGEKISVGAGLANSVELRGGYEIRAGRARLRHSGELRVAAHGGRLRMVARMPLEEYVALALAGETTHSHHDEYLKAMAVAVRTYAFRFRGERHKGYDYCDTTHCQDLRFDGAHQELRKIVEATRDELLWFEGRPAATYYHQHCGGTVAAAREVWPTAAAPYLKQKDDLYCARKPQQWSSQIAAADMRRALEASKVVVPEIVGARVLERTRSGRARLVEFAGPGGATTRVSASTVHFAVGRELGWSLIRSEMFEIASAGEMLIVNGRGGGHGVGLCQAGALEMGRGGKSYREILEFYYPGTRVGVSAQGIAWQTRQGDGVDLLSAQPGKHAAILKMSERLLKEAEQKTGMSAGGRVQIQVYPTVEMFRDATGEPGWVAASTRGLTIRMQPPEKIAGGRSLEQVLRHEMLHAVIEANAAPTVPRWFREGLVMLHANELQETERQMESAELERILSGRGSQREMRTAYQAAGTSVRRLVATYGIAGVHQWLSRGLPPHVR